MKESYSIGIVVALGVALLVFARKFKHFMYKVYGDIDKVEFGGFIFLGIFIWMLKKDSVRTHEWSYFSDIIWVAVIVTAITGLGLKVVFKEIRMLRGYDKDDKRHSDSSSSSVVSDDASLNTETGRQNEGELR